MRKHVNGWILNSVCFVYEIVRVGFCYAIYLTIQSIKENDDG